MTLLHPRSRTIYLSALRPPEGYVLDRAIGTTFSLDLPTLLSVPLAFALFDRKESTKELLADPVLLLEALRRYGQRTSLFCQTGQIALPTAGHPLYLALEPIIIEARAPTEGGAFHPKVWVLRFTARDGPVIYRVLVLSRNLSADRSWDTILTLEGPLIDRQNAFARNHPLGDFISQLPNLATGPIDRELATTIRQLSTEIRKVDFKVPEPFEDFEFVPVGVEGFKRNPLRGFDAGRSLIISPFLSPSILKELGGSGSDILISRRDEMDKLASADLTHFSQLYTLDDDVETDEASLINGATPETARGLHTKLYVLERGWDATVLTGSANATSSAFRRNVEFCVALSGKKSKVGIDPIFNGAKGIGLASILAPYSPRSTSEPLDEAQQQAEDLLEGARRALLAAHLAGMIAPTSAAEIYSVEIRAASTTPIIDARVSGKIWPVTLPDTSACALADLAAHRMLKFPSISLVGLSAFFACELTATVGDTAHYLRFVMKLPLANQPEGRERAVLRNVVGSREQLLKYLLLLLAEAFDDPSSAMEVLLERTPTFRGTGSINGQSNLPLLEYLVRAFARKPEKLEPLHRLVEDLRRDTEMAKLLPAGFERVWDPIWIAWQKQREEHDRRRQA